VILYNDFEEDSLACHALAFVEHDVQMASVQLDKATIESTDDKFLEVVDKSACELTKKAHAKLKDACSSAASILKAIGKESTVIDSANVLMDKATSMTVTWALLTLLKRLGDKSGTTDIGKTKESLKKIIDDNLAGPALLPYISDAIINLAREAITITPTVAMPSGGSIEQDASAAVVEGVPAASSDDATLAVDEAATKAKPKPKPKVKGKANAASKVKSVRGRGGRGRGGTPA
jgi:hypothetical protein